MIVVMSMTGGCCGEVNGGGERQARERTFFSLPLPSPSPGSKERRKKLKTATFLRARNVWRREREALSNLGIWGLPGIRRGWRRLKRCSLSLPSLPEGRQQLSQRFSLFNFFQCSHFHATPAFWRQPLWKGVKAEVNCKILQLISAF